MYDVVILPAAAADIDDIWSYLSERSPKGADRVIDGLTAGITLIGEFPLWFQLHGISVRRFVVGAYLIFYTVSARAVTILRIVHGARDLSVLDLDW